MNTKIAISGELGSGKTVLSARLSQSLGMEIVSVGKIQRELAMKYGMTTLEFNKYMETHPEIDEECDAMVTRYGLEDRPLILDSRLAWNFVPHSFKVHLLANPTVAATRIFNDKVRKNERFSTMEEARDQMIERKTSETIRFNQQYGVDINSFDNYNLVLDTSHSSPETIFSVVLMVLERWRMENTLKRVLLSPKSLLPLRGICPDERGLPTVPCSGPVFECTPVSVACYTGKYYILQGHRHVSESLLCGADFIPCSMHSPNSKYLPTGVSVAEQIKQTRKQEIMRDWEAMHGFGFSD